LAESLSVAWGSCDSLDGLKGVERPWSSGGIWTPANSSQPRAAGGLKLLPPATPAGAPCFLRSARRPERTCENRGVLVVAVPVGAGETSVVDWVSAGVAHATLFALRLMWRLMVEWSTPLAFAAPRWLSFPLSTCSMAVAMRCSGGTYSRKATAIAATAPQLSPQWVAVIGLLHRRSSLRCCVVRADRSACGMW
jgi:hypothetical protein